MKQVDEPSSEAASRTQDRLGKGKNAVVQNGNPARSNAAGSVNCARSATGRLLGTRGRPQLCRQPAKPCAAKRPTGSIFKPFRVRHAITTGLSGDPAKAMTQATIIDASEGTFDNPGKPYSPHNFDPAESVAR